MVLAVVGLKLLVVLLGLEVLDGELDVAHIVAFGIDGFQGSEGGEEFVVLA